MEGQIHAESSKKITLNLDEFDIDSYDFKPVTKGLGFHEPKKKNEKFPKQNLQKVASQPRVMSAAVSHQMPKKDYLQSTPLSVSDPSLMTGIEALYAKEKVVQDHIPKEKTKTKKNKVTIAKKDTQFTAFLVDLLAVSVVTTGLIYSFFLIAGGGFQLNLAIRFLTSSVPYVATLFALIFITYFSLTEPVGTFGKRFLGICTTQASSLKPATIRQSFIRSTITLFSLFLMGLPTVLDFQGKLSDTRVIKK